MNYFVNYYLLLLERKTNLASFLFFFFCFIHFLMFVHLSVYFFFLIVICIFIWHRKTIFHESVLSKCSQRMIMIHNKSWLSCRNRSNHARIAYRKTRIFMIMNFYQECAFSRRYNQDYSTDGIEENFKQSLDWFSNT